LTKLVLQEARKHSFRNDFLTGSTNRTTSGNAFFTGSADNSVSHPGKGGCADPVNEDAILERVGGRPPSRNRERQLASDTGDGKT
jgi:hypothetical protein